MGKNLPLSILLAFAGNSLIAVGQSLQKSQVSRFEASAPRREKIRKVLFWVLGIASSNAGLLFIYLALNFGSATVVGAMNASALVVLILVAKFFLKEPIPAGELAGVILIVAGVALMPLRALPSQASANFDLRLIWTVVAADAALFAISIAAVKLRKAKTGFLLAAFAGTMTAASQVFQKISHSGTFLAGLSGFPHTFYKWVWIPFFLPSVLSLQFAYRRNKAVNVIPVFNAFTVASTIAAGQFFFGESLSSLQWTSIAVILSGVAVINVFALAGSRKANLNASGGV